MHRRMGRWLRRPATRRKPRATRARCRQVAAVVVLCAFAVRSPRAQEKDALPAAASQIGAAESTVEYDLLRRTSVFSSTTIGFGAELSREAFAFRRLLARSDADAVFRSLYREARTTGRLYALCGLYWTDRESALRLAASWRAGEERVAAYGGCIVGDEQVATILRSTDPLTLRLLGPDDTVEAWIARQPHWEPLVGYVCDITGGGYPLEFRGPPPNPPVTRPWEKLLSEFATDSSRTELLVALRDHEGPAPPALLEALESKESHLRRAAVVALHPLRFHASRAAEPLGRLLIDPEIEIRMHALNALTELGPWSRPATEHVHRLAQQLPERINPDADPGADPEFARLEDFEVGLLVRLGQFRGDSSVLVDLLSHPNPGVRDGVLFSLHGRRRVTTGLAEAVLRATRDAVGVVRARAVSVLGSSFSDGPSGEFLERVRQHLIASLKDSSRRVRVRAITALGGLASKVSEAGKVAIASSLLQAARTDPSWNIRAAAMVTLASQHAVPHDAMAHELVLELALARSTDEIDETDFEELAIREEQSSYEELLGWGYGVTYPFALYPFGDDLESLIVQWGREDPRVVDALLTRARRRQADPAERIRVIRWLGEIGPAARSVLPFLENVSPTESYFFSLAAAEAAVAIGGDPRIALEIHRGRFVSGRDSERRAAVAALKKFGTKAQPAIPWLLEALASYDGELAEVAAAVLAEVVDAGCVVAYPQLLPQVIKHIDEHPTSLLPALLASGVKSEAALRAIERLRDSEKPLVRMRARQAYDQMR